MNNEALLKTAEMVAGEVSDLALDLAAANQLLSSSIIRYLADQGVIDLQDYLLYNEKTQQNLVEMLEVARVQECVKRTFEAHRRDFERPE